MSTLNELPQINEGDFYEAIGEARKAGRHVDFLDCALENYEWYKKAFSDMFTAEADPSAIYLFRAIYLNKPNVWREIEMAGKQTFEHLAKEIVKSMGWRYDHMHSFTIPGHVKRAKGNTPFGFNIDLSFFERHWEDDPFPVFKSSEIRIHQLDYGKCPRLDFIFDFGDGHQFTVEYRGKHEKGAQDTARKKYPALVDQHGVAPAQY